MLLYTKVFLVFCVVVFLSIFIIDLSVSADCCTQSEKLLWRQVSGIWEIGKIENYNYVYEKKVKSHKWGYNELINYNSLITVDPLMSCEVIQYNMRLQNPISKDISFISSFGMKEDRAFYGFRFVGNDVSINNVECIQSVVKDSSLPVAKKWNYQINVITSASVDIKYNADNKVEIKFLNKKIFLYLNGIESLAVDVEKKNVDSGYFGFSSCNVMPMIWDIKVYNKRKLVFSEDFSTDRVRRIKVRGTIEKK